MFLSDSHEPAQIINLAEKAEDNGVDSVWLAEHYCSTDAVSVLGALAVKTQKIKLASGIVSPLVRHPMTVATAASTIASLSGGRFILGVGAGAQRWVEDYLGLPYHPTLGRIAEAVKLIRKLLNGAGGDFQGRWFHAKDAKIMPKPTQHHVPIYLGAVGEKMKSLAFQVADGLILSAGSSLNYIIKTCEETQRQLGSKPFEVVVFTFTCINRDSKAAKDSIKPELATILSTPGRAEKMLAGYGLDLGWYETLRKAVDTHDTALIKKLITDEMVEQLAAAGTLDECLEFLSRLAKNEIVSTALVPCSTDMRMLFKLMQAVGGQTL